MVWIAAILVMVALCSARRTRAAPPGRQRAPDRTPEQEQRQREREQREQEQCELAELELEHLANLRKLYQEQAERLERERQEETSQTRLDKLDARLLALDEKLWRLEMRRAKLTNLVDRTSNRIWGNDE